MLMRNFPPVYATLPLISSSTQHLPALEQIIQSIPEYMRPGISPLCSYVVAKYATDSAVRSAAIADIRNSNTYLGKWLPHMAKSVPELAELIDSRRDLGSFVSKTIMTFENLLENRHPAPVITTFKRLKIVHKIFKIRRDSPHLLPVFAEILAGFTPGGARLCTKFAVRHSLTNVTNGPYTFQ